MADAVEVLDHRHAGVAADALNQALATAGDDHIHILGHADQRTHRSPVGGFHDLHRGSRQTRLPEPRGDTGGDRTVRGQRLGPAAQDRGIRRLQAETGRLHGDVGARLVNDADHPQRHPHAADLDAARHAVDVTDAAHRVGKRRHLLQTLQHGIDPRRGELQAIQQRRIEPALATPGEVLGIGLRQAVAGSIQRLAGRQQGGIALRRTRRRQLSRGGARRAPQLLHVMLNAHSASRACFAADYT